jgi:2-polyprenyl-3-methyl-5-hydroxy-6-metoxy-1,4-benzoquinol methylase
MKGEEMRALEGNPAGGTEFPETMPCPLAADAPAIFIETRSTAHIAGLYIRDLNYDPTPDFNGLPEIALYECEATGYRFFYPFTLEGKECLYRAIEHFDWCYEEGKWEHEITANAVPETASVLDVGCGRGAFLSKVRAPDKIGIELNKSAAAFARKRGIAVVESLIGDHAKERPNAYDIITSFQVLEHIADPLPFLHDCLTALKPGGQLIIAVPNNDAFIRFADLPLNQPPHHVGLWSPRSLAALEALLPMRLEAIEEEPLRELDWYQQVIEHRYLPKRWQRSVYYRLGGAKILRRFIEENRDSISGHTVIAKYRKH